MLTKFVHTSNVKRFLAGFLQVERRGAGEACWMEVDGHPGLGKSKTLNWWALHNKAIFLRAKSNWRPGWMLEELVHELGQAPERGFSKLFDQAMTQLSRAKCPLVIDEGRNMLHDVRLLETIRDLTDALEMPFILGGEEFVGRRLETRYPQISSRITSRVRFDTATVDDVALCCKELSEVPFADDLYAVIHAQSRGYYREIKNAIATAEEFGKRNRKSKVTADDMKNVELCRSRGTVGR